MVDPVQPLQMFAATMQEEFNEVSDYIWKSSAFIKQERELELSRWAVGLDGDPQAASLRWELESRKLFGAFPSLLVSANIFAVCSFFELRLAALLGLLKAHSLLSGSTKSVSGVSASLRRLREAGFAPADVEPWPQVHAAIKIRNALMHAGGLLEDTHGAAEITRIIETREYLVLAHREIQPRPDDMNSLDLRIIPNGGGQRLMVTNGYPFVLTGYFKNAISQACSIACSIAS